MAEEKNSLREGLNLTAKEGGLEPVSVENVEGMIGKVVGVALQFLSIIFLIVVVYAGLRWMLANGDPTKIKEARGWMINGAIGLLLALMSYQIVSYLIERIQIQ